MKKTILIFILIFSLSFCCLYGCQKKEVTISNDYIMLSLDLASNGVLVQSLRFSLNNDKIDKISPSQVEKLKFRSNLISQVDELRKEFLFSFALVYVNNPIDQYKINRGVILTQTSYDKKSDSIGFDIIFTSQGAWQYYHQSSEQKNDRNNNNIFYNKSVSQGHFPFSSFTSDNKMLGQVYREKYISSAEGLSFEEKIKEYNPQFLYNYSTPFKQIKSDAQLKFKGADNRYHHMWIVNGEDLNKDNSIMLYTTHINKGWWLFFALILPLIGGGSAILIIKARERSKLNKKLKNK